MADSPVWKTITIPLAYPIEDVSGDTPRTIDKVTISEPNLDQLTVIEELDIAPNTRPSMRQIKEIISALSGLSPEVVGKFHRKDVTTVGNAAVPLLAD